MTTARINRNELLGMVAPMSQKDDKYSNSRNMVYVGMSFGLSMGIQIYLIGFLLGRYLDQRWGTEPWMLIVGVLLAVFSAFYTLLRTLSAMDKAEQKNKRQTEQEQQAEEEEH